MAIDWKDNLGYARSVIYDAQQVLKDGEPAPLLEAAAIMLAAIDAVSTDLHWEQRHHWHVHTQQIDVHGHTLREGTTVGGPRHFLDDEAPHAGTGVWLLTDDGWLRGRYEWTFEPGTPAEIWIGVGRNDEAVIQVYPGARLCFRDEI